jgi:hypothetical protein
MHKIANGMPNEWYWIKNKKIYEKQTLMIKLFDWDK